MTKPLIFAAALFAAAHCTPAPAQELSYLDKVLLKVVPYPLPTEPAFIALDTHKRIVIIKHFNVELPFVRRLLQSSSGTNAAAANTWCKFAKGSDRWIMTIEYTSPAPNYITAYANVDTLDCPK